MNQTPNDIREANVTSTSVHFSTGKDNWATPQDFFDKLDEEFKFTLDAAADETNYKCSFYYDEKDDALKQHWFNWITWCNPPYSNVKLWIKKAYEESLKGGTVVMLIPARTDTKAWHEYIFPYAEIRFVKGRLKFGDSKNSAPFPSAVVIFRGKDVNK